ncbi:DUF3127 domain-containing protein [Fulvivirga sediminis]|uniref:DUF3127 domain-containing protein n=1 Tax=Fulvivirga sediminis TaxID=2803949 RepID=A0A937K0U0_9BACT|nr:DUF3127 domain-containing protein [Fulvivirga sediminis]MBL3657954.1 DUF3127 domain-containing protein [Fulvivirga sediminis]
MNVKGKILEISSTQQVTSSFQKREFVLEYAENPQYPEFLKFEMIQDKCALLDIYKVGDDIDVYFNLKGRKWTDPKGEVKYFNSLQAWKLEGVSANAPGGDMPPPPQQDPGPMEEPGWVTNGDEDDLPF